MSDKYPSDSLPYFVQDNFPGALGEIYARALEMDMPVIPAETARFLITLLSALRPHRILEIGCAVGFSAGLFASLQPDGGKVITIDRYPLMINIAKENFKNLGLTGTVTLLEGDAGNILPNLEGSFDFIFLDAAKAQYINFLPHCLRLLSKGGVMCADDIFLSGMLSKDPSEIPRRHRTAHKRMHQFLDTIFGTDGLQSSLLPIGGGLSLTVKTKE